MIPAASLVGAGSATLQVQIYRVDDDNTKATSNTVKWYRNGMILGRDGMG